MRDHDTEDERGGFDIVFLPTRPPKRRTVRARKRCDRYTPGHTVHWIHAKKASQEPGEHEEGTVVAVGALITIRVGDELRRYFNHQPERFADAIEIYGHAVRVDERWHLLGIGPGYVFNVRRIPEGQTPKVEDIDCDNGPTGGFVINLSSLRRER